MALSSVGTVSDDQPTPTPDAADLADPAESATCFVLGGRTVGPVTLRSAAPWLIVAVALALPVRALWNAGGSFDEGLVLTLPERLLKGDLPNKDFLHLYGPGSIYLLAGWYRVFGVSIGAERALGLLQHVATLAAALTLLRPYGRRVATVSALVMIPLAVFPTGLAALAWSGAVPLALWSLVLSIRALHLEGGRRHRALLGAGLLAGLALSLRPDLVLAVGLTWLVLWPLQRWNWRPVAGLFCGLAAWWVHFGTVGVGTAWRGAVTDPVVNLRAGRSLPHPPSLHFIDGFLQGLGELPMPTPWWGLPSLTAPQQMFLWFFVVIATNIAVAIIAVLRRRRERSSQTLILAAAALFGLGLTGQAWQRPDSTHLALGWMMSATLVPVVVSLWLKTADGRGWIPPIAARIRVQAWLPASVALSMFLVVCPYSTLRTYLADTRASFGNLPTGHAVTRGDRSFILVGDDQRDVAQAAVDRLAAEATAGQRLFVGPADLRRTVYDDPFIYHLFPELTPATYFIELDPGLANAEGSSLADDVASADWLVLTNFWTSWYEPNSSADFGSDAPNQVVADQFCLVESFDDALILLYRRCAEGDGVEPWTLGVGPERIEASKQREAAYLAQR